MKPLDHYWYSQNPVAWLLLPLAGLFCLLAGLRRGLYRAGLLTSHKAPVPVIVVGNISVGGTGKTPLIIHLCQQLKAQGYRPGVISRGYGGHAEHYPLSVNAHSDARQVGDEPLLIARRTGCPVAVGPDRLQDIDCLLAEGEPDIILADDGLQHYRLRRDGEIAVVDVSRLFGNGFCIPAGPLREPVSRLQTVDLVLLNGGDEAQASFRVLAERAVSLADTEQQRPLQQFAGQRVHAVAGIGHPQRFFHSLRQQGIDCIEHVFADHHDYQPSDLQFADELPVLMTEKDAVKCFQFDLKHHWYVPVDIILSATAEQGVNQMIEQVCHG